MFQELFIKSNCCCCQDELNGLAIECSECQINLRLCFECFSLGSEIGNHKSTHKYHFIDTGSIKLNSSWTAKEQLRLLDAIEKYGFGNWQDISKYVETKNSTECKDEYVKRFVNGSIGQASWISRSAEGKLNIAIDHTIPDDGPLSPSFSSKLPPLEIGEEEISQLGYMPQRDDYEKEFDNEAERLVSQLNFSTEDEDIDIALKLAMVDMYMKKLRDRCRRKRVIRDYQLVSQFFNKKKRKTNSILTPFAQFSTAREEQQILSNLEKEKELKVRLSELYKYRKAGIAKIEDCFEYEKRKGAEDSSSQSKKGQMQMTMPQTVIARELHCEKENPRNVLHTKRNTVQLFFTDATNSNSEEFESDQQFKLAMGKWLEERRKEKALVDQSTVNNTLLTKHENKICRELFINNEEYIVLKTALILNPDLEKPEEIADNVWNRIVQYTNTL